MTFVIPSYFHLTTAHTQNLCLQKSLTHNIRSARLPIGTYLSQLKTRHVLTVNQTFEILLRWVESRDWENALEEVVPKRKFAEKSSGRGGLVKGGGENEDEEGQGEGEGVVVVQEEDVRGNVDEGDTSVRVGSPPVELVPPDAPSEGGSHSASVDQLQA